MDTAPHSSSTHDAKAPAPVTPDSRTSINYGASAPQALPGHVVFTRDGDTLTVIVPAPPFARQLFVRSALLLLTGVPGVILTLVCVASITSGDIEALVCIACAAIGLDTMGIYSLRRLIFTARQGHKPHVLRLTPEKLEVTGPGKLKPGDFWVNRELIVDLFPSVRGFTRSRVLMLKIKLETMTLNLCIIPWRRGNKMIAIEDSLREALALPPLGRRK